MCYYFWYATTRTDRTFRVEMGGPYSSYFDFNNKKLYLLFEIVKYWVLTREFAKWIELVCVLFVLFDYVNKEVTDSFCERFEYSIFLLQPTMKIIFLFHLTYWIPSIFQGSFHPEPYSRITFICQFDPLQKVFAGTRCQLFSPVTPQHKPASGRRTRSLEVFETGTVLDRLGALPRVPFSQIQASKHVPAFFHCGPEPAASPSPGRPGDRVGAAATSSIGKQSLICFRQDQLGQCQEFKCIFPLVRRSLLLWAFPPADHRL